MKLREDGLSWQSVDGTLVIMDLKNMRCLTANSTATFLMHRLVQDQTHEDLVEALMQRFDVPDTRARADVEAFVASLSHRELLV